MENAVLAIALTLAALRPVSPAPNPDSAQLRLYRRRQTARCRADPHHLGHVIPMCQPSVIIRVTLNGRRHPLTAAALGFLGLGAQPPQPEWGLMISAGRKFLFEQWWVATMPGLAIFIVSLGFNLLGDGLRDVLDPKSASK